MAGRAKKSWEMCACAEADVAAEGLRFRAGDLGDLGDANVSERGERGERGPEMADRLCLRSEHKLSL